MRFAVSPMWQVLSSFRLLRRDDADAAVHGPWLAQVRPRVAAAGLDRGWLAELIPAAGFWPYFLNPAPDGPAPALSAELAAIRSTPAERVRHDLEHLRYHEGFLGPRLRALHADPAARLARVTQEIQVYFEQALAPYWARVRAVLDTDVLHRARQVAEHGAGHAFNDLHASLRWDGDALHLLRRTRPMPRDGSGPGLVLAPTAFGGPRLASRVAPPDPPQLAYPARGAGTLWERGERTDTGALAGVLGRSRARLLADLDTPASTTQLAARTGLSAPTVSQCLAAMRAAGLVSAHRVGRSVLYARTAAGESLLSAGRG
ncbi:MAG TPA: ArsR family transcriptional regulator [Dactylosporangium sp.]|nr:ArsR family transcriptional regulator [Dactylosporangium sp.]